MLLRCDGNTERACKCRGIIRHNITYDYSKRPKYDKGDRLCLRGGGECLFPKTQKPIRQSILQLFPNVCIKTI